MCTVRCPIRVESEDNRITWIEGNRHLLGGALCAKGTAGIALLEDKERPQQPLIRVGARGAGRWREVGWDEALDYVADKMSAIKEQYGPESAVLSSRGGPWQAMYKAFTHAFGSPNSPTTTAPAAETPIMPVSPLTGSGARILPTISRTPSTWSCSVAICSPL
jgi:thiosulfate reductase/polysulfide reductase chain A